MSSVTVTNNEMFAVDGTTFVAEPYDSATPPTGDVGAVQGVQPGLMQTDSRPDVGGAPTIPLPSVTLNSSSYEWLMILASMNMTDSLNQTVLVVNQALKTQNQKIQNATDQRIEKLQEAIKKLGEIAEAEEEQGIWGMLAKVFSYIGAVFAVAGGVLLTAVNPALGAVVVGVAVLALAGMISKECGGSDVSVGGLIGLIVQKAGGDKEQAALASMISNVVINLVLAVVSFRAVSAVTDVSEAIITMTKVTSIVQGLTGVGSGVAGIGCGVNGLKGASLHKEGDMLNVDAKLLEAFAMELTKFSEQWLSDLKTYLDVMDTGLKETVERVVGTHLVHQQNQIV